MTGFAPITGPGTFEFLGSAGFTSPTTTGTYIMGPIVGINGGAQPPSLYLPAGYNNNPGTPLDESEAIFANRIIACVTVNPCGAPAAQPGLGVQPGSYTWTWGSATSGLTPSNRDQTFTICTAGDCPVSPPSEIPVPAALPLFATGIGGLGLLGWRRKRRARGVA